MALLQLIFGGPKKAQVGTMQLDASVSEEHTRESKITQHPIEDGSNISDHVTLTPKRVRIQGVISDSPISFLATALGTAIGASTSAVQNSFTGGASGILASIASRAAALGLGSIAGLAADKTRTPEVCFQYLDELWQKRERFTRFTIITVLNRYDNMIIQSLTFPRNSIIGKALHFTITAEEVTVVSSSLILSPTINSHSRINKTFSVMLLN